MVRLCCKCKRVWNGAAVRWELRPLTPEELKDFTSPYCGDCYAIEIRKIENKRLVEKNSKYPAPGYT